MLLCLASFGFAVLWLLGPVVGLALVCSCLLASHFLRLSAFPDRWSFTLCGCSKGDAITGTLGTHHVRLRHSRRRRVSLARRHCSRLYASQRVPDRSPTAPRLPFPMRSRCAPTVPDPPARCGTFLSPLLQTTPAKRAARQTPNRRLIRAVDAFTTLPAHCDGVVTQASRSPSNRRNG